jgi:hypothetical protein
LARKTLTDSDIRAIVQGEIQNADGYNATRVSTERADNLNAYFARPYGNEVEGRSQVVSRTIQQVVEGMMPSFMRIFTSGEDIVSFEPSCQEHVESAKQATEYVNHIWQSENHGFRVLYEWIKDALISKNGIIKIWWDDTPKTKRERYSGLDDQTFAQLVADKDVEVAEHTESQAQIIGIGPDGMPAPQEITVHDVVITRTIPGGKVCIHNVPPEEFLISKDGRDIEQARLVGHRRMRTLSDLRQSGFPAEKIDRLGSGGEAVNGSIEEIARDTVEDQTTESDDAMNEAMTRVWVTECYIKIDVDGDGIAEMRKVTVAGPGYTVLSNDAWDGHRPFATLTPIIMPHRFWGMCPTDLSKDDQLVKTVLWRQFLDNAYQSNNQREEVVFDRLLDADELLSVAPGRKIRVKAGNGPAISPIPVPQIGSSIIEALNYMDSVNEANTGVSERTQGLGANALHDTASGERQLMTAAMGKIELMARVFAEGGIRDAFRLILKLVCMYQDKPRTIKLTGGWVPIYPSGWDADMTMKASVGLGMGDRDQKIASAGMLGSMQQKLLPLGFITPENLKNSAEIGIQGLGLSGVERFVTFPQGDAAKQPIQLPQPQQQQAPGMDPKTLIAIEQARGQAKVQVATVTAEARAKTDALKSQADAQENQHLNQVELQRHSVENQQEMEAQKYKTIADIVIAHINAAAKIEAARVAAGESDGAEAEAYEQAGESYGS